ncbi:hypothetical protein AV530_009447 [Patagioenas fasciata monilis]|uniref:Uncharacterized protein n=1 Tax=Patagioenas fasciata monilis TaxID=372326 RepID=A0A1V4JVM9_PATFA|nr:hypothetical protein AV530_009447 [Patagioenas fasciata monilis]
MVNSNLARGSLKTLDPRLHEGDRNSYLRSREHPEISVLDKQCCFHLEQDDSIDDTSEKVLGSVAAEC